MYYILRRDDIVEKDKQFSTEAVPFDNEKEAYKYCLEQCVAFPLSTFMIVSLEKEYHAKIVAP